ncbi:MAG: metalloregulator ArsR/SmtB family transcription factor [Sphingomonadaceae bacterium]|nr:winged helix-turn-helix transcriptional regulator [Sphingomonadaceae bacterium]
MNATQAIAALSALAQEHRLAAFRLLVEAGRDGLPAGQIAERLAIPNSSLSFHLTQLSEAGLVQQRRDGRSLVYSANFAAMNGLTAFLTENCCGGESCAGDAAIGPVTGEEETAA